MSVYVVKNEQDRFNQLLDAVRGDLESEYYDVFGYLIEPSQFKKLLEPEAQRVARVLFEKEFKKPYQENGEEIEGGEESEEVDSCCAVNGEKGG